MYQIYTHIRGTCGHCEYAEQTISHMKLWFDRTKTSTHTPRKNTKSQTKTTIATRKTHEQRQAALPPSSSATFTVQRQLRESRKVHSVRFNALSRSTHGFAERVLFSLSLPLCNQSGLCISSPFPVCSGFWNTRIHLFSAHQAHFCSLSFSQCFGLGWVYT